MEAKSLLEQLRVYAKLQRELLALWRQCCAASVDVDDLLDFPIESRFEHDGDAVTATVHGAGVRFQVRGGAVDVPYGVGRPEWFDSDRFFDWLGSLEPSGSRVDTPSRDEVAQLFERWRERGELRQESDLLGRPIFTWPS